MEDAAGTLKANAHSSLVQELDIKPLCENSPTPGTTHVSSNTFTSSEVLDISQTYPGPSIGTTATLLQAIIMPPPDACNGRLQVSHPLPVASSPPHSSLNALQNKDWEVLLLCFRISLCLQGSAGTTNPTRLFYLNSRLPLAAPRAPPASAFSPVCMLCTHGALGHDACAALLPTSPGTGLLLVFQIQAFSKPGSETSPAFTSHLPLLR